MFSALTTRTALKTVIRPARRQAFMAPVANISSSRSYATNHDNDPEILDREKRRNLSREKYQTTAPMDHAPGWNEHLATTSEHAVKADATPGGPPSEDLQAQTVQHLQKKHSPEERYTSEAVYERDEISGPLGSAKSIEADASEEVGRVDGEWRQTMVKERTEEEVVKEGDPTSSEAHVKADRGEI